MTDEYLAFCVAYDWAAVFEYLELPCDEAFALAMKLVTLARKWNSELYYDNFMGWLEFNFFHGSMEKMKWRLEAHGLIDD